MTWAAPLTICATLAACVLVAQTPTAGQEIAPWIAAISNVGLGGLAVWMIVIRGPQEARERREEAAQVRREYFDQMKAVQETADRNRKEALEQLRSYFGTIQRLVEEVHEIAKDTNATSHEAKHLAANLYQASINKAALEQQERQQPKRGKSTDKPYE